jgi:hypothetical protein
VEGDEFRFTSCDGSLDGSLNVFGRSRLGVGLDGDGRRFLDRDPHLLPQRLLPLGQRFRMSLLQLGLLGVESSFNSGVDGLSRRLDGCRRGLKGAGELFSNLSFLSSKRFGV